jgi:hypothetical protein
MTVFLARSWLIAIMVGAITTTATAKSPNPVGRPYYVYGIFVPSPAKPEFLAEAESLVRAFVKKHRLVSDADIATWDRTGQTPVALKRIDDPARDWYLPTEAGDVARAEPQPTSARKPMVALAIKFGIPKSYSVNEFAEGLMLAHQLATRFKSRLIFDETSDVAYDRRAWPGTDRGRVIHGDVSAGSVSAQLPLWLDFFGDLIRPQCLDDKCEQSATHGLRRFGLPQLVYDTRLRHLAEAVANHLLAGQRPQPQSGLFSIDYKALSYSRVQDLNAAGEALGATLRSEVTLRPLRPEDRGFSNVAKTVEGSALLLTIDNVQGENFEERLQVLEHERSGSVYRTYLDATKTEQLRVLIKAARLKFKTAAESVADQGAPTVKIFVRRRLDALLEAARDGKPLDGWRNWHVLLSWDSQTQSGMVRRWEGNPVDGGAAFEYPKSLVRSLGLEHPYNDSDIQLGLVEDVLVIHPGGRIESGGAAAYVDNLLPTLKSKSGR